jgi:hypothetical protein
MKYDPEKSFGYPVLSPGSDDYLKANFQTEIDFDINKDSPRQFQVEYTFACSVKEFRELVAAGDAAYWLKVSCRSTFYSKLYEVSASGTLLIEANDLRDLIEFSGFIIAKRDSVFGCDRINPEFGYSSFSISNGQVLAQGLPRIYITEKEFWKPISSIFEYQRKDELKDGEYSIDLDAESGFVEIFANEQQCQRFKEFEKTKDGKAVLLSTVFFVAVSKMIEALQEKPDDYAHKKWARVLEAKAASKNINLKEKRMLLAAHRVLDRPLRNLSAALLDK